MSISLIKTIGGLNGSPNKCKKCNSAHFVKIGMAWNCIECGTYIPAKLNKNTGFQDVRYNLDKLLSLQNDVKNAIREIEQIVKE